MSSASFPARFSGPAGLSGPVLRAESLTRFYGAHRVLDGVSLSVDPGRRVGVVGENGIGKSTLLRLLAGVEEPDSGSVSRPPDLVFLGQEPSFGPSATVAEVMADALADVRAVEAALEAAAAALADDPDGVGARAYERALARAEAVDVWGADRRAEVVLAGLGMAEVPRDRASGRMSGGQRSRLALAAVLVRRPSAVVLDEPTNHLDDEAAEFLAAALRDLPGAVVLASHDRVFLDEVCTEIFDLDPSFDGPTLYGGTYSNYFDARRIERERWEERWLAEREERAALRQSVRVTSRAVGHNAARRDNNKMSFGMIGDRVEQQVARRVRDAQRRLDELEASQVRRPPTPLRLAIPARPVGAGGGSLAVQVSGAVVPGRLRVDALDLASDARLLVTGANGSGKSTLLHLLAGDLTPAEGAVHRARGMEVALLEQDVGLADDARTPRQVYELVTADLRGAPPLTDLGLVAPRDLDRPLRELSVGQRRRVVLALLVARAPRVLLLDEPTNHISLTLAEELADALGDWPGAVVVATHDRWLRRGWGGDTVAIEGGRLVR
ncbi:ABC-F family ATP-binding cassette domain-containing protein [Cellulomonas cellasea]|uniref:ABC-F family ATP-binding cassette domain-containing protein n=1 Tax=Cellulomonas cellasea TaxID=43670 RepID=UPI0025A4358B|nr:ABC-F family ATP-binding cassette domain-containing protein [Cellulomonas cellasea]MDM8085219.1 ABC-F family ATP-binding cassette domain-containing protein [Cellulomonas cellasea]